MKKLMICVAAMLLVLAMGAAALAAVSVQMTVTPDKTAVARGETVTFTVSTEKLENCRSAGFAVHYDKSVFEFVEGKCLLAGVDLASVGMTNDILSGVFACSEAKTVAGGIFSFTMKVKDTAALGTSAISITASARDTSGAVSCNAAPVSLTIQCRHSWGKWSKADEASHKRTCTLCPEEETAAHSWDGGIVTKEATCKEAGVKTYTCPDCTGTRTEELPKTENHTFGPWTYGDESTHKQVCTVCTKEETAAHGWDEGLVIQVPTCKDVGIKLYRCADCTGTRTEELPKTENHTFGPWTYEDENAHKQVCTVCTKEETAAHSWDGGAVTKEATCKEAGVKTYTCPDCSGTRTEELPKTENHTFGPWTYEDENAHKQVCTVCAKEETAAHEWSHKETVAATCTEEGYTLTVCAVCSQEKKEPIPSLGHDMVEVPAVAPTCAETGLTAGTCCQRCQTVGVAQAEVPALEHRYENGACTVCGEPEGIPGDLDGNDQLDEDDAVFLLQHVLMPDLFPATQEVDYDGNGEINEDDAVYLLQHVLMPDLFPL